MSEDIKFDTADLEQFVVELGYVSLNVLDNAAKAMQVTSRYIKDHARKTVRWSVGRRLAPIVYSINYDVMNTAGGLRSEIGYDRDKPQGNLGHIIEYGSVEYGRDNVPNAPQLNLLKAMQEYEDDFISGMRKAVRDGFSW